MQTDPIEKVRRFWNARPCNILHSDHPVGSAAYMEATERRKYFVEPHIPGFADFAAWKDKKVLEVGCGIGTDTVNFARAGAHVTAVDLSEESIAIARKRASVSEQSVRFYQGNAEKLTTFVPIEPYDLIYSFGAIHHTVSPVNILKQMWRYTKPGTVLKIMVYHRFSWKAFWIMLKYGKGRFWKMGQLIADYSEAQIGCPETHVYSSPEIIKLVEDNGFLVTKISVDHIFAYDIPLYKKYQYRIVWYFRWMPKQLFKKLEHLIGWHILLEAVAI